MAGGPDSRRPADQAGERAIGDGAAARDAAQRLPDRALKLGAAGLDRQAVDRRQIAGEIGGEGAGQAAGIAHRSDPHTKAPVLQAQQPDPPRLVPGPLGRPRSETRRGGQGGDSPVRYRWWPYYAKTKQD